MKEKLILLFLIITLTGCAQFGEFINGPEGPKPSVCDVNRPAEFIGMQSHICDVVEKAGITPETVDGLLLDATAMAYVVDAVDIKTIEDLLSKANKYLLKPEVTFTDFIEFLDMESDKALVLKNVLNRRIYMFRSGKIIDAFDMWMIQQSILHQAQQFGLKVMM